MTKLKKAHRVYFVQKDTPRRMDYRFGYKPTPPEALKYRVGQWVCNDYYGGRLRKRIFPKPYDTREEAEAIASKYNEELYRQRPQDFELAH